VTVCVGVSDAGKLPVTDAVKLAVSVAEGVSPLVTVWDDEPVLDGVRDADPEVDCDRVAVCERVWDFVCDLVGANEGLIEGLNEVVRVMDRVCVDVGVIVELSDGVGVIDTDGESEEGAEPPHVQPRTANARGSVTLQKAAGRREDFHVTLAVAMLVTQADTVEVGKIDDHRGQEALPVFNSTSICAAMLAHMK
jgi:hypothetical protein